MQVQTHGNRHVRTTVQPFTESVQTAPAAHLAKRNDLGHGQTPPPGPSLEPNRLQRVLEFIDAELAEDISPGDLADQACLSPFLFSRLFRQTTGLPPYRYLTQRRIYVAQALLTASKSSIVEIALETGFSSQANFTRTFRKLSGVTPGQYRRLAPLKQAWTRTAPPAQFSATRRGTHESFGVWPSPKERANSHRGRP